ncbi:chymotrypsinogen A-like [Lineus longissimus]|uniref:chymotrypsinogen A-like n=1 Tax=Lineus longissimus TaxID=88925 RepID=UPI002B4D6C18
MKLHPLYALLLLASTSCLLANSQNVGCGQISPSFRIIGGSAAKNGQWPWQISLQTTGLHYCGGSLLDEYTVVTAAHCIADDILGPWVGKWTVVAGTNDLSTIKYGSKKSHRIRTVKKHERFDGMTHNGFDIAIIKLKTPVVFDDVTSPICLPESQEDVVPVGADCVVSGFGLVDAKGEQDIEVLQFIPQRVIENSVCEIPYRYHHRKVIHDDNVCAGGGVPQSACHGDSGGPLSCYRGRRWVLDGIVSWGGAPCGKHQEPDVYCRTSHYVDWIAKNRQI